MLSMALMLAVISTGIEMVFVVQFEWIRNFMLKFEKLGLFFSLLLSYAMGLMFHAEGLTALFGALLSTVFSIMIYKMKLLEMVDKYRANKIIIDAKVQHMKHIFVKSVKFWWKFFTAPVRFAMWVKSIIMRIKNKVNQPISWARTHLAR